MGGGPKDESGTVSEHECANQTLRSYKECRALESGSQVRHLFLKVDFFEI